MKIVREARSTSAEFIAMFSQHVLDRYQHSHALIRPAGTASKATTSAAVFLLLGQKQRSRRQLNWRNSLLRDFHIDPLLDKHAEQRHWVRYIQPTSL